MIKGKYYGIFYRRGNKWCGPLYGELLTDKNIKNSGGKKLYYNFMVKRQKRNVC